MVPMIDWGLTYGELQMIRGAVREAREAGRGTIERLKDLERLEVEATEHMELLERQRLETFDETKR